MGGTCEVVSSGLCRVGVGVQCVVWQDREGGRGMVKRRGHLGVVVVDTFPLRITTTGTGRPRYPERTQPPDGNGGEGGATGYCMKALQLVPSGCFSQSCPIMPPSMPCADTCRGATEAEAALACSGKCPASTSSLFADMMKVQSIRRVSTSSSYLTNLFHLDLPIAS